jgi:hypothetical protein
MYPVYPLVLLLAAQALRFCEALFLYVMRVIPSVHFDRALLKKADPTLPPIPKLEKGSTLDRDRYAVIDICFVNFMAL